MAKLQTIELKPGVNKNNTPYTNEAVWVDCDKIRFRDGKPRKMGGWVLQYPSQYTGVARAIQSWSNLGYDKYLAVATNKKVQINHGGVWYDITPYQTSSSGVNLLSTTSGLPTVNVHIVGHNCLVGDYVFLSNSSPIGCIS